MATTQKVIVLEKRQNNESELDNGETDHNKSKITKKRKEKKKNSRKMQ